MCLVYWTKCTGAALPVLYLPVVGTRQLPAHQSVCIVCGTHTMRSSTRRSEHHYVETRYMILHMHMQAHWHSTCLQQQAADHTICWRGSRVCAQVYRQRCNILLAVTCSFQGFQDWVACKCIHDSGPCMSQAKRLSGNHTVICIFIPLW